MSPKLLITRTADDCHELAARLQPGGWEVVAYPVLRLAPVEEDPGWEELRRRWGSPDRPAWLVFLSPRGPAPFVAGARARGLDDVLELPVAAIGPGTADAVRTTGLEPRLTGPGTGAGLARDLIPRFASSSTIVLAAGRDRRPDLTDALTGAGHEVIPVVVYAMEAAPEGSLPHPDATVDAVLLTSPRSAHLYLEHAGGEPLPCPHWALGPTTRDAARGLGLECRIPATPDLDSFAEELCPT